MVEFSFTLDFVIRFMSITLIDLALSGDNAVVIGMAAASLPKNKRKWAVIFGGGLAIVLRIALTAVVTLLMKIPLLSAIGGCVLFWVAWKLLKTDTESSEANKKNAGKNFKQAIILIVTADFMMSLDNIIAIAGSAHGSIILLVLGLLVSMPLLIGTGSAISYLIDKFKWLIFAGAAVICFTGTRMIFEDSIIEKYFHFSAIFVIIISVIAGVAFPLIFKYLDNKK